MKLKRMFETLLNCRPDRKKYYIEKKIKFEVDEHDYMFSFLPTVIWVPWPWRHNYSYVVEIWWLNFNIGIGVWREK